MQKWEYAIGTHTFEDKTKTWEPKILGSRAKFSSLSEMLNYMGEQGYELVNASAHVGALEVVGEGKVPYTTHERFYLKRPKTE